MQTVCLISSKIERNVEQHVFSMLFRWEYCWKGYWKKYLHQLLQKTEQLKDITLDRIHVPDFNFLPLHLASGLLLHIISVLYYTNLIQTYSERGFWDTTPFTALPIMTCPSITFEWLIISQFLYLSEFRILNISEFFSNLSTCVLVGFRYKTGSEPRFDKIYAVKVQLKSTVFIQHLMVF